MYVCMLSVASRPLSLALQSDCGSYAHGTMGAPAKRASSEQARERRLPGPQNLPVGLKTIPRLPAQGVRLCAFPVHRVRASHGRASAPGRVGCIIARQPARGHRELWLPTSAFPSATGRRGRGRVRHVGDHGHRGSEERWYLRAESDALLPIETCRDHLWQMPV
jgi:hypothetical protein